MKKILGAIIILVVFTGLFCMTGLAFGWLLATGVWVCSVICATLLYFGLDLMVG